MLTRKYYEGSVPAVSEADLNEADRDVLDALSAAPAQIADLIRRNRFRDALQAAMGIARLGNKYMTEQEPWKAYKTDPERTAVILNTCIQVAANCAVLMEPFLPKTAAKLQGAFSIARPRGPMPHPAWFRPEPPWANCPSCSKKLKLKSWMPKWPNLNQPAQKPPVAERNANPKKIMTFEDFQKLDLRVGEVVACERVPKADRLLNLTIRTGLDERTVLSGIAEHFEPEDVVGRRVTLLVNLAPRKIRGIESQGMVLMAETADGSLRFVTPEEGTQAGDVIR